MLKKSFFLNQSLCCYSKEDVYLIEAHPQVEPSNEQILRLPVTVFIKHRHSQNHNYLGYKGLKRQYKVNGSSDDAAVHLQAAMTSFALQTFIAENRWLSLHALILSLFNEYTN